MAFEAWLVLYLQGMLLANNRKEHLRHRAVSLRQHGFLVSKANGMYKRHYVFRMNVMEEIVEIRSCSIF